MFVANTIGKSNGATSNNTKLILKRVRDLSVFSDKLI